jgi:hypothetical protein
MTSLGEAAFPTQEAYMPELDEFGDPIDEPTQDLSAASSDTDPDPEGEGQPEEDTTSDDGIDPETGRPHNHSKVISRRRFDEVNNKAAELSQEVAYLRDQAMRMAAFIRHQHQQGVENPDVDPETMAKLKPYLEAGRIEDRHTIQELRGLVGDLQAQVEFSRAWSYFEDHVPDWRDIQDDVIRFIESKPKSVQKAYREDVEAMIEACNEVRKRKGNQAEGNESAVRASVRGRAHSEGAARSVGGKAPVKDWMAMDSETFKREQAKVLAAGRRSQYVPPDDDW